jgi:hypothetical protein
MRSCIYTPEVGASCNTASCERTRNNEKLERGIRTLGDKKVVSACVYLALAGRLLSTLSAGIRSDTTSQS